MYGANIIKVGGTDGYIDDNKHERGDSSDQEEESVKEEKVTARTNNMSEALFFHAMPVEFFEELIHDYSLGAIICIGVGDGAAALACLRHGVPFTGFCLTEEHKTRVRARLEEQMVRGALERGDKWCDPQLVAALTSMTPRREEPSSDESASTPEMGAPESVPGESASAVASPLKKRARQATPSTGQKEAAPVTALDVVKDKPKAKGRAKVHHRGEEGIKDARMDQSDGMDSGTAVFD